MFEDIAQMEKEIEVFRKNIVASTELVEGITDLSEATRQQKDSFASSADALTKKLDACILQFKSDHETFLRTLGDSNAAAIEKMQHFVAANMQDWVTNLEVIKTSIESCESSATQKNDEQIDRFVGEGNRIIYEMQTALATQQNSYSEIIKAQAAEFEHIKSELIAWETATNEKNDEQISKFIAEAEWIISEMKAAITTQQNSFAENTHQTEEVIHSYQAEAETKYNSFVQRLESTNVDQIFKEVQELKKSIQAKFTITLIGIGVVAVAAILSIVIK